MLLGSDRKRKDFTQLILYKTSFHTIVENIIWHLRRIRVPFFRNPLNDLNKISNKAGNKALQSSSVSSQNKLIIYSSLVELLDNWGERSFSLGIRKLKDLKNHTKFGILTALILSLQIVKWTVKSNIHFSMDPRSMRLMGEKQGKMRSCKHTCYNAWCTSTVIGDNVGITRSWIWISLIWCPFHNLNEICHKTWDKALENASIPS